MAVEIQTVGDRAYQLGEGPLWDADEGALYWVDALAPALWRFDPDTGEIKGWDLPGKTVGSLALRRGGGAVLAMRDGFHFFDFTSGACQGVASPEVGQPRIRMNDGKVDRQGRFVAGSADCLLAEPLGAVYRLDRDASCHRLDEGFVCSNGPSWSPDGETFYFADSLRQVIYAYDYDLGTGRVGRKRVFASTTQWGAEPDGSTVDAEGYLWSALFDAGRVARFAPDGRLDRLIEVPARFVSSVMFGGASLDILYVTSISIDSRGERDTSPGAGRLFAIHGLGLRGLPELRFAG